MTAAPDQPALHPTLEGDPDVLVGEPVQDDYRPKRDAS